MIKYYDKNGNKIIDEGEIINGWEATPKKEEGLTRQAKTEILRSCIITERGMMIRLYTLHLQVYNLITPTDVAFCIFAERCREK